LAEGCGNGYVCCVAAGGHENPANAGLVVAGVEGPPATFEVDLEPGAEVHGKDYGNANVSQIAGGVACRDVEGAAEGDCEVLEVAADADAFREDVESRLGGPRVLIVEPYFAVDPVADGLDAAPARVKVAKQLQREGGEAIDLTVAAGEEEFEHFTGQIAYRGFVGVPIDLVDGAGVLNEGGVEQPEPSWGCDEAYATVAEIVGVVSDLKWGFGLDLVRLEQVAKMRECGAWWSRDDVLTEGSSGTICFDQNWVRRRGCA